MIEKVQTDEENTHLESYSDNKVKREEITKEKDYRNVRVRR